MEVEAGKEPPGFKVHFPEWRLEKAQQWLDADPVKVMKGKMFTGLGAKMEEAKVEASKYLDPKTHKFDYE